MSAYPPPQPVEATPDGPCYLANPAGWLSYQGVKDSSTSGYPQNTHPRNKGDVFWKGWWAILCLVLLLSA
ncbi:hypothetical protein SLEP1_g52439 [Rubroshorea leprosula]|uniref:Uncharacterized protein n=1 Tax=Rubroshorea leprosula TaxID=152421 RepID=A0AAV5M685_9ROSI|nr:hypothetical protein SLEP1_g52439 [Rubroshorea leprosula]